MSLKQETKAVFDAAKKRSDDGLLQMQNAAKEVIGDDERFIVGVNGSYARREVTSGSDVDLFVLYRKDALTQAEQFQRQLRERLVNDGFKMPATGGVFSSPLTVGVLSQTIGGMDDTNEYITRRMLLLLEGEWVYNKQGFNTARERLLSQYLSPDIRADQIALFLLNDIIRYWRTICVDFEYKVQTDGKPRAIRLIKLRFSRMMLFAAGVLAVGATHGVDRSEKLVRLSKLLALPAYERIIEIAGENAHPILALYAEFLSALDDEQTRQVLSRASPLGENSAEFAGLRVKAHQFRAALLSLFRCHFGEDNPTLAALML